MLRRLAAPATAVCLLATALLGGPGQLAPADASGVDHGSVVSDRPERGWPQIADGSVDAGDQVGDTLILGGSFGSVNSPGVGSLPRTNLVALDVSTGAVSTGFNPVLNGPVSSIEAGDTPGTVFVGGSFTSVNGTPFARLVKLDIATGQVVPGFKANVSGEVKTMTRFGDRLWIGGSFTKVRGVPRANLAEVSATSGAVAPGFTVGVTGARNNGCRSDGLCKTLGGAIVRSVRVTPDGTTLVVMHRG